MFLTISVWRFIGDVLQMNRRCGTVWKLVFAHWFHSFRKTPQNPPEYVELSEFVFSLHLLIIFILYASMWSHHMFSLFCQKEPTERTPFGELFERWRGKRLRPRPDRMPDSEICHNTNKWGSFFSLSDEEKKMRVHVLTPSKLETKSSGTFW